MIGALIGAGLSIASKVAGGIASRKARKKQERMLEEQKKENQAWYDRRYNEDPTKRADTMRLLTQMQEQIRNRNKAARGRQAVMGGTEDSTTAVKEANNKALADTTSQLVAANEKRKDAIERQYMSRRDDIRDKQMDMQTQKQKNTAEMMSAVGSTAAEIASSLDGYKGNLTAKRPYIGSLSDGDLNHLDAKAGVLPNQHQVADSLTDMIGGNAPHKA